MLETLFGSVLTAGITAASFTVCLIAALALGALVAAQNLHLLKLHRQHPNRSPILDYYNIHHYNDYDPQPLQYLHQI